MVEQFRDGFDKLIQFNPKEITYFDTGVLKRETVRISHEASSVQYNGNTPVGLGTSFSKFVEMYWDSTIFQNAVITDGVEWWKVGPVDPVCESEGEIGGKHAPLTKVKPGEIKAITSLKIGLVSGVIVGTNITVTLPIGTDISALLPVIVYNGKMISPTTAQNFATPKTYTVTAENLTTQNYTVTVVLV